MSQDDRVNEIIYTMEILRQQLEELEAQEETLNLTYQDILTSLSFIRDINKVSEKSLIPIGKGLYVQGKIEDKNFLYVDIGSGIIKKANLDESRKILEERKKDIENSLNRIAKAEEDIKARYAQLELALEKRTKK
jgi:prefoldin, archaeal alpha subunit/eukaryotic subunit 5